MLIRDRLAVIIPIILSLAGTIYPPTLHQQTLEMLFSDPFSPWKIIVRTFIHGDLFHFASNMIVFYLCSRTVLNQISVRKAALLFFAAALISSLAEVIIIGDRTVIGMSGATMAIFSFNIIICLRKHLSPYYYCFVLVFLAQDIVGAMYDQQHLIAHWAHLAGFATGLAFAMYCYRNKPFGVLRS